MQTSKPLYTIMLGITALTVALPALAARTPWAIRHADDGVFAGIGYDMWRYQEATNGVPIDSQSGGLTVYTAGLSHIGRHDEGLYARLQLTAAFGTTRYQGNGALGLPAQGSTAHRITAADGRLGLVINGLWWDSHTVLIPYLGAGFHRFVRAAGPDNVNPGGTTLTAAHLGIGLGIDYALDRRWVLTLHAFTGYTLGAQIIATAPVAYDTATGTLESARLTEPLSDRPYTVLGLTIRYRVDPYLDIAFAVRRATWSAAGAAPIPIAGPSGETLGMTRLPGSQSAETTMLIEAATPF